MTYYAGPWTPDSIAMLEELWRRGRSGTEVASAINNKFGLKTTRNSVIGKLHRLAKTNDDLKRVGAPVDSMSKKRTRARNRPLPKLVVVKPAHDYEKTAAGAPASPLAASDGSLTDIMRLSSSVCHWPHGDPREPGFAFCGRSVRLGSSYCEAHKARAFIPFSHRLDRKMKSGAVKAAAR